jgi:hypothetical protein
MTESERIKLTILLHQHTPAERLRAMEIATCLEFMEGRDYQIIAPEQPAFCKPQKEFKIQ